MRAAGLLIIAAVFLTAGAALAQSGADVVKAKGCNTCHEADKKKIGPSFRDIAAKYKDDKGAEAKLIATLKEGKGHPKMVASGAELKAAVGHVLSTK